MTWKVKQEQSSSYASENGARASSNTAPYISELLKLAAEIDDPNWRPEGWDEPEPYGPQGDRCPMCKNPNLVWVGNHAICPECKWTGEKFEMPPHLADSWQTRDKWPNPESDLDRPLETGKPKDGCTCDEGNKLTCPLHGMDAVEPPYEHLYDVSDHVSPRGINAEQPRTWLQAKTGSPIGEPVPAGGRWQAKTAATPMGFGTMYHVSPRSNRGAILTEGLQGHEREDRGLTPQHQYEPDTQPEGNYLFDNWIDAEHYTNSLYHKTPKPYFWEDRWDYPEDEEAEPYERDDDPLGYDIYAVNAHGIPLVPDPEAKILHERATPVKSPGAPWDLGRIYDNYEHTEMGGEDPEEEMGDDYGWEPRRYWSPVGISPDRVKLHRHYPRWKLIEHPHSEEGPDYDAQEAMWDDERAQSYPQPWALTPMTEWPMPGHEGKTADAWDTRQFPDSMNMPPVLRGPAQLQTHPEGKHCTCEEGKKLDCPLHGMDPSIEDPELSWSIPEQSPVGYPQDQPRQYTMPPGTAKVAGPAEEPPHYRKGTKAEHCSNCKMFDKGHCWGYGEKKVKDMAVCDSWAAEKTSKVSAGDDWLINHREKMLGEMIPEEGTPEFAYCPTCKGELHHPLNMDKPLGFCPHCEAFVPWEESLPLTPQHFEHPDPMMDTEPGSLKLPEHWGSMWRMTTSEEDQRMVDHWRQQPYLYHASPQQYRAQIEQEGLTPRDPAKNGAYVNHGVAGVYVEADPESALYYWGSPQHDLWEIPQEQIKDLRYDPEGEAAYIPHTVRGRIIPHPEGQAYNCGDEMLDQIFGPDTKT